LDLAELTELKTAMKLTDEQWADILERVDLDKDGKIDAKEFVLLCQTLNKKDNLPPKKVKKAAAADSSASGAGAAPSSASLAILGAAIIAVGAFAAYQSGALDSFLGKKKGK
jgi:hypothetical protein